MSYGDSETSRDEGDLDRIEVRSDRERLRKQRDARRVEQALDDLDRQLMALAEQIERASGTLGPVLVPPRPIPAEGMIADSGGDSSALRDRLDAAAARAHALTGSLREVLDRVDL